MKKSRSVQKVTIPAPDVLSKVVPAPTDGWDAISPLASMDPKRAPILNNWIPRPGWVELRTGFLQWISLPSMTTPVESLMVRRAEGIEQMFAASGSSIFDVSVTGAPVSVVTGLNSARWQYVNFTPALGTTVIQLVNGVDSLRMYKGTSWTTPTITGLPGGLTTASINNIWAQKRRLWYVMGNGSGGGSTVCAFMPTDAIMGAAAGSLDLGANWTKGGFLVAVSDWTVDGGNGPQDYVVFISSRGQVTIFSGTDPTSATAFSLVGTFDLAPPLGSRCATKIGSDVGLITQQGVLPLSQALPFDPSAERSVAITARIQNAMAQAAASGGDFFGWQLISFAPQQLAILNVPQVENQQQVQFVMNALTGAWCQFTGWNANCFEVFNDTLYFGGNLGDVNECFNGSDDFGKPILGDMQCAFNYFDAPGRIKRMTMVQPFLTSGQTITPFISIDSDFTTQVQAAPLQIVDSGALWDVAVWDTSTWFGGTVQTTNWISTAALGHALAVHLTVNIAAISGAPALFDFAYWDVSLFDASSDESGASLLLQVNAFNALLEMGGFV